MRDETAANVTRRGALRLLAVGVASAVAGCASTNGGDAGPSAPVATPTPTVTDRGVGVGNDAFSTSVAAAFARGEVASVRLIGDSITAGYGCEGYGDNGDTVIYQGGEGTFLESAPTFGCWANDFRAFAEAHGVAAGAFVNAGISGARMSWLADEPAAWLADADVMAVMLGTNDAAWSSLDEYEANARVALAAAAGRCSQLVVISPPNNWRDDGRARFTMAEADEALARVCGEAGYVHVTAFDAVAMGDGTMNDDGIHPTTAGSHAIWKTVATQLGLAG